MVYKVMDLLSSYPTLFSFYGLYLYHAHPALPRMLVLIFLPVLLSPFLKGSYYGRLNLTALLLRRRSNTLRPAWETGVCKETLHLWLKETFRKRYLDAVHTFNQHTIEQGKKSFRIDLSAACVNMLGYVCMIGLLLWLVIHGHIALASFAAILGSVRKAYEQMEEIVQQQAGEFSVAWALSKNYFSFMAEPEEERSTAHKAEINELALQDVCFAYPDGTQALNGVSIEARCGDCIAVVGENGSGKTTLAKLLTGIYAPSSGSIYCGGSMELMTLRRGSSQLFQHFNNYRMTVAENVGISDSEVDDPERMLCALETAGFPLEGKQSLHWTPCLAESSAVRSCPADSGKSLLSPELFTETPMCLSLMSRRRLSIRSTKAVSTTHFLPVPKEKYALLLHIDWDWSKYAIALLS